MHNRSLYIFDLDGTLSLATHRLHLISEGEEKRWREFYEACDQDEPNTPVIELLNQLHMKSEIWIFTGRSDVVREKTIDWLFAHTSLSYEEMGCGLIMRKDGDYRHDCELKQSWLRMLSTHDRERLRMVFEDRDRVVQMWRSEGVPCLQVADGTF